MGRRSPAKDVPAVVYVRIPITADGLNLCRISDEDVSDLELVLIDQPYPDKRDISPMNASMSPSSHGLNDIQVEKHVLP
jgi:hypothetical protein